MGLLDLFRSRASSAQAEDTPEDDAALAGNPLEAEVFRRTMKRQIVRLLPTAVCAQWVKANYQKDMGPPYPSVKQLRADAIAFLIPWEEGDQEAALAFVEQHYAHLWRSELVMHETDPTQWPQLTLQEFRRWYEVQVIEMVVDMADLR